MPETNSTEEWRPVPGKSLLASTQGRIQYTQKSGKNQKGDIVYGRLNHHGYPYISADRVHALIAAAFIGPRPKGKQINHKNGIKNDNRPSNLEYVTPQQNIWHSTYILGNIPWSDRTKKYWKFNGHQWFSTETPKQKRLRILTTIRKLQAETRRRVDAAEKVHRAWIHKNRGALRAALDQYDQAIADSECRGV